LAPAVQSVGLDHFSSHWRARVVLVAVAAMGQDQCKPTHCRDDFCEPVVCFATAGSNTQLSEAPVVSALQSGGASSDSLGALPLQEEEEEKAAVDALAAFFLGPYFDGKACEFPGYTKTRRLNVDALLHAGTGVVTWTHAVDLRGGGESSDDVSREGASSVSSTGGANGDVCLFHYADAKTFVALADGAGGSPLPDLADMLLGQAGPFGHGLQCCRKPPHLWESRSNILMNCRWPRREEVDSAGGSARKAPGDERNVGLLKKIIEEHGEDSCGFCVPIICRRRNAMAFRGRQNRWGERVPSWLDAYVVYIDQDHRADASRAAADIFAEVRRKRGEPGGKPAEGSTATKEAPRPAG